MMSIFLIKINILIRDLKRNDRFIIYGLAAAKQAVKDSGIDLILTKNKKIELELL